MGELTYELITMVGPLGFTIILTMLGICGLLVLLSPDE